MVSFQPSFAIPQTRVGTPTPEWGSYSDALGQRSLRPSHSGGSDVFFGKADDSPQQADPKTAQGPKETSDAHLSLEETSRINKIRVTAGFMTKRLLPFGLLALTIPTSIIGTLLYGFFLEAPIASASSIAGKHLAQNTVVQKGSIYEKLRNATVARSFDIPEGIELFNDLVGGVTLFQGLKLIQGNWLYEALMKTHQAARKSAVSGKRGGLDLLRIHRLNRLAQANTFSERVKAIFETTLITTLYTGGYVLGTMLEKFGKRIPLIGPMFSFVGGRVLKNLNILLPAFEIVKDVRETEAHTADQKKGKK